MSFSSVLSIKVYFIENKETKEIRKFSVDSQEAKKYEIVAGKVRNVFQNLLHKDLDLFWRDNENDYISISTDQELEIAFQAVDNGCLKLYVKEKPINLEFIQENSEFICDACNTSVIGAHRYVKIFDLCSECNLKGNLLNCKNDSQQKQECSSLEEERINIEKTVKSEQYSCRETIQRLTDFFGSCPDIVISSSKTVYEILEQEIEKLKSSSVNDFKESLKDVAKKLNLQFLDSVQAFFQQDQEKAGEESVYQESAYLFPNKYIHTSSSSLNVQHELAQKELSENKDSDWEIQVGAPVKVNAEIKNAEYSHLNPIHSPSCDSMFIEKENILENDQTENTLEKSLAQMEAMGFDNNDGCLKQLLIINDCRIDKVLDTLNPAM